MSKRKRGNDEDDYERRSQSSVGNALSRVNGSPEEKNLDGSHNKRKQEDEDDDGGEWETATSKRQKRRKPATKEKGNYPELGHSNHARLQSFVKIGDLQNLALYFLADGTSPQWCSIKNHGNVRKVVTLMVPGLEAGMFNGDIPLESDELPDAPAEDSEVQQKSAEEATKPVAKPEPPEPAFPAVNPFAAPGVSISAQFGANPFATPSAGGATAAPVAVEEKAEVEAPADSSSVAQQEVQDKPQDQPAETPKPAKRLKLQVSPDDFYPVKLNPERLPKPLRPLADMFDHLWPIKTPGDDRYAKMHSPMQSMLTASVPRPKGKDRKGPQPPSEARNWKNRREPVTEMLATTAELLNEGYAMHPAHFAHDEKAAASAAGKRQFNCTTEADGWLDTAGIRWLSDGEAPDSQIEKDSITVGRDVLAMDCEMCITSPEGVTPQVYSLTRISLIDWNNKVILDEFVKPADPITNYLTPYSGITPASLEGVTTTLSDIHAKLAKILTPHTILVGHSLDSDLNALHITHPFIIDTALLYPHPRGPPLKSSLKYLAQKYLSREIQRGHGSTGHDSVEDAAACLDLVKQKCEKGKSWGTPDATNESIFRRLSRYFRPKRDKANMVGEDERRSGAVVDWGEPMRGFGSQARVAVGCESDVDVVHGIRSVLEGDSTGKSMPTNGVDFAWARLRELEAHRGWWNRSKTVDADALRSAATASSEKSSLDDVLAQTTARIKEVYEALPPCTAFVVYAGSGDPRELAELQAKQKRFKDEYQVKKWDEVSVTWTDEDEKKLRLACEKARRGLGFVCIK